MTITQDERTDDAAADDDAVPARLQNRSVQVGLGASASAIAIVVLRRRRKRRRLLG